ncbi:phage tail protein [Paraburkholderia sp. BR10936]|uniref:phage tail protein n=1 Tax=Paraburkholderia sp. BR10936 TaxID=3236993 RepID=UPI0034D3470A
MQTSLLLRPDEDVFASAATAGEIRPFPDITRGWGLTFAAPADGGNGGFPPMEWFNQLLLRLDSAIQYFIQRGVTEWASTTLYAPGSAVSRGALLFRALRANQNVIPGNDPNTWAQLADAQSALTLAPPGMVGLFAAPIAPAGWLKMNGASLSRVTYSALFGSIGTTFGAPDSSTFLLPDVRGEFMRAWDDGRGVDRGRGFGTWQSPDMQPHQHGGTAIAVGDHGHGASAWTDVSGWHGHGVADNGHSHGVIDNGHAHTYQDVGQFGRAQTLQPGNTGIGNLGTTYASSSNIGIAASGSNIGIFGDGNHVHGVGVAIGGGGAHAHSIVTDWQGGTETRPRNYAFLACIKY